MQSNVSAGRHWLHIKVKLGRTFFLTKKFFNSHGLYLLLPGIWKMDKIVHGSHCMLTVNLQTSVWYHITFYSRHDQYNTNFALLRVPSIWHIWILDSNSNSPPCYKTLNGILNPDTKLYNIQMKIDFGCLVFRWLLTCHCACFQMLSVILVSC